MFGREKASKCNELITNVRRRLDLLKNDKSSILKRSRAYVAQLLKQHDYPAAFDKAQQIYKHQSMLQIYDLLDYYCDVVARNLSYICKHKNCPDYLKVAISTLIFASGKFEELPELCSIRRLLGKRYGNKFVKTALELRAGNHVMFRGQINEVLNMMYVHDYVKYKLLTEIESSCNEPGTVEYRPCLEEEKVIECSMSKISSFEDKNVIESSTGTVSSCEEEPVLVDVNCETKQFSEDPLENSEKSEFLEHCCDDEEDSASESETFVIQSPKELIYLDDIEEIEWPLSNDEDSASELETSVVQLSEEVKYLDDIEEIASPVSEEGILQNQKSFEFKTPNLPLKEETYKRSYYNDLDERIPSRNSLKMKRAGRHSSRRTMASLENIFYFESPLHYGHLKEASTERKKEI